MKPLPCLALFLVISGQASAYEVYPGCESPGTVVGRTVHFVDPQKGTDTGTGTTQKPWKSLSYILNPANKLIATNGRKGDMSTPLVPMNTSAPIKGGDVIMLMSGDYGDVTLQNLFNDKFITVMAAPGQAPIISHLRVTGATRWAFQGLTFRFANPSGTNSFANVTQVYDGWQGASSNVVFDSSTFTSAVDTSGWSDGDWMSRPELYSLAIRSSCVSVTNSLFRNVENALALFGPKVLIKNNIIDRFSNDAIDLVTGDATILGNTIQNSMTSSASGFHPDGIQGWSQTVNGSKLKNSNVLIDSNNIYNANDKPGNYLQGIDMFNGLWDNLTVQNNVVITNHWHGISVWGARNTRILNNTVMPSNPGVYPSWISVQPSSDGASQNVLVRNNVAYQILAQDASITLDHNATSIGFTTIESGKLVRHTSNDTDRQNLVIPSVMSNFRSYDPSKGHYDVRLNLNGVLVGAGNAALAPALDIVGRSRSASIDLGAYVH